MNICIFCYFGNWFCSCDLVRIDASKLDKIVCNRCENAFKIHFKKDFKDTDMNFKDFMSFHINERLKGIAVRFGKCEHRDLTDYELNKAYDNLAKLIDNYCWEEEKEWAMDNLEWACEVV